MSEPITCACGAAAKYTIREHPPLMGEESFCAGHIEAGVASELKWLSADSFTVVAL